MRAAFIEENRIEDIWGSAQQTIATGGRANYIIYTLMEQVTGSIGSGLKPKMEQVDLLQLDYLDSTSQSEMKNGEP